MIQRIFLCIRKFTALSISLVFVATLLVSGCTGCGAGIRADSSLSSGADNSAGSRTENRAGSEAASHTPTDAAFEEFCNELFRESLSESGLSTHIYLEHPENYGITDYPLTIGGYDIDGIGDTTHITDALARLKSFPEEQLSYKNKLTYDEIKMYLETELEYSDVCLYDTSLSINIGSQLQLPLIFSEYPIREEKDVEEYLCILKDTDEYFANIIEFEKLRAKAGIFMEDTIADEIIHQCSSFLENIDDGFLVTTFNNRIKALNLQDKSKETDYIQKNKEILSEHVAKGYEILIEGITSLKGSCQYSGGIGNSPEGRRFYEYYLKSNVGWNKSVEDFNSLINEYIIRTCNEIRNIAAARPESYRKLSTFEFQKLSNEETLAQLKEMSKKDYPEGTDIDYNVCFVDKSLSEFTSPAMYFTPQIDNIKDNTIYINPDSETDRLYATLAHEGFPGHMYQHTYFASTNPNPLRYILSPTGYIEGWATYTEIDSYNYADTGDDYLNRLNGLNHALILMIYASVDMGVSYYGWTPDDVEKYLSGYGFGGKETALDMYTTMVSEPGNYCRYVLGYIGIMELKQKAEELLGDNFNTKEFNTFILETGPIQFDILFNRIEDWAASQQHDTSQK